MNEKSTDLVTAIHSFKKIAFPDVVDKRFSEMTQTQQLQAHENWIRSQFGWMHEYSKPHISLLLNCLDNERETVAALRQQVLRFKTALNIYFGPITGEMFADTILSQASHETSKTESVSEPHNENNPGLRTSSD